MTTLDRPIFTTPDAEQAIADLQKVYEDLTGKTLFPAQPETLLTNQAAYLKTVVEALIQYTGEQNLVNYADGVNLDQVGSFWGEFGARLPEQKALTTLKFTLTAPPIADTLIPDGFRVQTTDGEFIFSTIDNGLILAGADPPEVEVEAECDTPGIAANNYPPGTISNPFDTLPNLDTVVNVTTSNGGADVESDARYRERLKLAPNALSTAGSHDAYAFWVYSADPSIVAVSIRSPSPADQVARRDEIALNTAQNIYDRLIAPPHNVDPGAFAPADITDLILPVISTRYFYVEIYVLTDEGLPSQEILNKVRDTLSPQSIRPLNDEVLVSAPKEIQYTLNADVTLRSNTDLNSMQQQLDTAAKAKTDEIALTLGADIIRSQLIDALHIEGVHEVVLNEPAQSVVVNYDERPLATSITINITGVSDG